jgi:hypothetical protein
MPKETFSLSTIDGITVRRTGLKHNSMFSGFVIVRMAAITHGEENPDHYGADNADRWVVLVGGYIFQIKIHFTITVWYTITSNQHT